MNQIALIPPYQFVHTMEDCWINQLHNVSSKPLKQSWEDLAKAFGSQIMSYDQTQPTDTWTVLQPPTGSGKSQGTAVYCAMLSSASPASHPGILIVTRLKADADEMADTINRLGHKDNYAFSYHSEKAEEAPLETLSDFPVLIVTHSAYERAIGNLSCVADSPLKWEAFHSWQESGRKLIVIDEAFSFVNYYQVGLEDLRRTLAAIPQELRERHPTEILFITEPIAALEKIAMNPEAKSQEAILTDLIGKAGGKADFSALRKAMKNIRFDWQQKCEDQNLKRRLADDHDEVLNNLQEILSGWVYYAKIPQHGYTLNTARLIIPEGVKGGIILDATASANLSYSLFDRALVIPPPKGIRSYRNVTLHVSKGHNVGKLNLRKNADSLLDPLLNDLNTRLAGRNTFFVTHKGIEAKAIARETSFKLNVGHWGAIDGSNEWRDCDSAVIFGIPARPSTWTATTYFAFQGVKTTEWLRSKSRPYKKHSDIRSALKLGQTIAEIVQAINRIQCRKVIDADGNCPSVDIYLLLPDGSYGDSILKGITDLMDGVKIEPWDIQGMTKQTKQRGRRKGTGDIQNAVLAYLKTVMSGSYSVSSLRKELGGSVSSMKRFIEETKNKASDIGKTLADYGVRYERTGLGRGAKSYFIKQ